VYPEDRVLTGVVKRKRDWLRIQDEGWYKMPKTRLDRLIGGVDAQYLAFYLNSDVAARCLDAKEGGIYAFAPVEGHELAYRRDLEPDQPEHPRADHVYYKVALGDLRVKEPPILNPTRRPVAFLQTTWDRFLVAETIADLYSDAIWFVDSVYRKLRETGLSPQKPWEVELREDGTEIVFFTLLCEDGAFNVTTASDAPPGWFRLPPAGSDGLQDALKAIRDAIRKRGGLRTIEVPLEDV
jgi:hypothetical protein